MSTTPQASTITTLCLNPALDVTYHVPRLIPEQKSRSDAARHDPGGNGINIGRALKRMQVDAHTFCIVAGDVGQILQRMLTQQLDNVYYEKVSGETRINSTIIELETEKQFQVTDSGTEIPQQQLNRIIEDFVSQTGKGFGIITGSCQPNVPNTLYGELVERINDMGGKPVVDTHGDTLKHTINAKPFLIKPNRYELETIINQELPTIINVATEARHIQQQGVTHVCVSLGDQGAVLVSPDNSYYAQALDVPVNTTVGAGDSMVAGLIAGFSLGNNAEHALRYGIACGAGTVMHPGTELFSGHELAEFRQRVVIETLDI
ncbi:MAG: 1-phosphofructokinase family hexose kinase [Gammaproteobacteria bacterium]|nr:1-phosphofructokinase family hexose kinase [Gammaproteobacteria bacterium]MDH5592269.1 1-phosphofructokinase family hexose kinase [Gammaproteobacteria bacterium]